MKKFYIKHILLFILMIIQIVIFSSYSKDKEDITDDKNIIKSSYEKKDIDKVFNDFKGIKGVKINSIFNEDKTKIDLDFKGDKKTLINFIDNIYEYNVSDYEIRYENEKFLLRLSFE